VAATGSVARGELVPARTGRFVELHVDLDPVSAAGLLVGAPAAVAASVALGGREPVEVELLEGAPDIGVADRHGVVPLELPGDVRPTKMVVLPQIPASEDDPAKMNTPRNKRSS
jgi:hypothetical protein